MNEWRLHGFLTGRARNALCLLPVMRVSRVQCCLEGTHSDFGTRQEPILELRDKSTVEKQPCGHFVDDDATKPGQKLQLWLAGPLIT